MDADEGKVKLEKLGGGFWKVQMEDYLYKKILY